MTMNTWIVKIRLLLRLMKTLMLILNNQGNKIMNLNKINLKKCKKNNLLLIQLLLIKVQPNLKMLWNNNNQKAIIKVINNNNHNKLIRTKINKVINKTKTIKINKIMKINQRLLIMSKSIHKLNKKLNQKPNLNHKPNNKTKHLFIPLQNLLQLLLVLRMILAIC
jgi:hypothetical protein